jgi:predicted Fe-Mo cluster-binding NifX family protein
MRIKMMVLNAHWIEQIKQEHKGRIKTFYIVRTSDEEIYHFPADQFAFLELITK